jgi:hypothetical protein
LRHDDPNEETMSADDRSKGTVEALAGHDLEATDA